MFAGTLSRFIEGAGCPARIRRLAGLTIFFPNIALPYSLFFLLDLLVSNTMTMDKISTRVDRA